MRPTVIAGIVKNGSRGSNNFVNEKFLAEFNPADGKTSASDWLEKVNTCGIIYDCYGLCTKLYLAVCKLRGNAKLWHDGLAAAIQTWEAFSIALIK